jgi:hydrogenase maturation protease
MKSVEHEEGWIGVIGLGNVLMGDDAFGPYVIQVLEAEYEFPERVVLMDLGTPSLDLATYIEDLEVLIILDSVGAEGSPGSVRTYRREELLSRPLEPRTNAHEPGLKEALLVSEFRGRGPREALFVGVVPEQTSTSVGLSEAVSAAIPRAVEEVLRELRRQGAAGRRRRKPQPPQVWWEGERSTPGAEARR